ncbi:uncharacterized protein [Clytia hemisphaerica]|uniref:uncharacterized protein n=1 Tax=Clytia hemisphaerica TaxID=252671 RepID=UPI0034D58D85
MKWRANQMMRNDLTKSSKTRLPKKCYDETPTTREDVEDRGNVTDAASKERLHRRNSQLRTDEFLSVPDFNRDSKKSGRLDIASHGKSSLSDGDLNKALKCQTRVRRRKLKQLSAQLVEETEKVTSEESETNQVTQIVPDNGSQSEPENEKVCIKIEYEQLHEEHATYKGEITSLKFALQRTAEEYAQLHQRNNECAVEIQSLKDANEESALKYKAEISVKDAELAKLNEQCCVAQRHIQELQVDIENNVEVLKKDLARKSSTEVRENEAIKKRLVEVEAEKINLAEELNSRLAQQAEDHELTKQRLSNAESKYGDMERLLQVEKEKNVFLKNELDSEASMANGFKDEIQKLTSKFSSAEQTSNKKKKELQTMTSKLGQREIEIRRRVEEIAAMMKQEKKLLASVQKQQLELESKNENVKRLRSTNKTLSRQRDESRAEVKRKDEEISKLKTKIESTQKYADSVKNEMSSLVSKDGQTNVSKKKNKKKKSNDDVTCSSQEPSKTKKEGVAIPTSNIYEVLSTEGAEKDGSVRTKDAHKVKGEVLKAAPNTADDKEIIGDSEAARDTPSQKVCAKKAQDVKNVLKKKVSKEKKERKSKMKNGKKQVPLSTNDAQLKWKVDATDESTDNKWWNFFFVLISIILLVSYFHIQDVQSYLNMYDVQGYLDMYDVQGYLESTTAVCQQAFTDLKDGVFGLFNN